MVTEYFHFEQQSENPGGLAPGFSMPFFGVVAYSHRLVTLFVAIQPFADEVLNHTCHDGDCDGNEYFHSEHPLSVPSIGEVTKTV